MTKSIVGTDLNIVVVGSGAMGAQIGMACALAGYTVAIHDISPGRLAEAGDGLRNRLDGWVQKGKLPAGERDAAFGRLSFELDLDQVARTADLVIEAVVEDLAVKQALFTRLDAVCPPRTVLTSNSSSFVPSRLAEATGRPDRICNLHFFNPALVMKCVEIVRGPGTSDETAKTCLALVERLGKTPVLMDKEINGFIANRILNAIRDEAVFLLEGGYASVSMVDEACRSALGHPMGPFELQDVTGLDIGYAGKLGRYEESADPADAPSNSLTEKVRAGHLGRKTGQGWYRYDTAGQAIA